MFEDLKEIAKDFKNDMKQIKELRSVWDTKFENLAQYKDDKEKIGEELTKLFSEMGTCYGKATDSIEKNFYEGMVKALIKKVKKEQESREG